jgi:MoxR-like ATPase
MVDYAVDLVRTTRPKEPPSPDFVKNWLAWGAGPRAAQNIILGAKARAILHGRYAVTAEDIRALTFPVLRHRIFTNFNADAEGVDVDQVIEKILETVPEPSYGESVGAKGRGAKVAVAPGEAPMPPSVAAPAIPLAVPSVSPGAPPIPVRAASGPPRPSPAPPATPSPPPRVGPMPPPAK